MHLGPASPPGSYIFICLPLESDSLQVIRMFSAYARSASRRCMPGCRMPMPRVRHVWPRSHRILRARGRKAATLLKVAPEAARTHLVIADVRDPMRRLSFCGSTNAQHSMTSFRFRHRRVGSPGPCAPEIANSGSRLAGARIASMFRVTVYRLHIRCWILSRLLSAVIHLSFDAVLLTNRDARLERQHRAGTSREF